MKSIHQNSTEHFRNYPDEHGYYGRFGGNHYPKELHPHLLEIARAYKRMCADPAFRHQLRSIQSQFQGRPTPVHFLRNLTEQIGGGAIFVKREDLNYTGAHKLNHCVGFALLARFMGKTKLIAETGAGQHGVAVATAAAYFGLQCEIHMGEVDIEKAHSNVSRMKILGATVVSANTGQAALKEASDSAFSSYVEQHKTSLYAIGSAIGPHPFPMIVRDFQSVVGREAREQFISMPRGELPDHVVACVAGGSNSLGIFGGFLEDHAVALHGVEPLGRSKKLGEHAATITFGSEGIIHGAKCILLQEEDGRPASVSSIASGLVYPGVGPEICMLAESGRVSFSAVGDDLALDAFYKLSRLEGIIPALESADAVAHAVRLASCLPKSKTVLINLSGRGDKDVDFVVEKYGLGHTAVGGPPRNIPTPS